MSWSEEIALNFQVKVHLLRLSFTNELIFLILHAAVSMFGKFNS